MRLHALLASITAWTIALLATPTPALAQDGCLADLNDDGLVNGTDLAIVLGGWGPCPVNTTFVGGVVKAGGSPVVGATVTTDLGGETVSGDGGIFLLQIELPSVIETVVLTATAEVDGVFVEGDKTVSPVTVGGDNLVGLIEVANPPFACDSPYEWMPVAVGVPGITPSVYSMVPAELSPVASLYVGGNFQGAGGVDADHVVRLGDDQWWSVGILPWSNAHVRAMEWCDLGDGYSLYVAASDNTGAGAVFRWNGLVWTQLGGIFNGAPNSLAFADDGSGATLYVGGRFASIAGDGLNGVARWSGTEWEPLGSGVSGGCYDCQTSVNAILGFDDGSGTAVYVGGEFTFAGGIPAARTARWRAGAWEPLGDGLGPGSGSGNLNPYPVNALCLFDDGTGPSMYAGGKFQFPSRGVARWTGSEWQAVGKGVGNSSADSVEALSVFDDGGGPTLFAAGRFTSPGSGVVKWSGNAWTAMGAGIGRGSYPAEVRALAVFDDGTGPALYVGGQFQTAGGNPISQVAKWGCPDP